MAKTLYSFHTADNLQTYRFRRIVFGITASPFLVVGTLKQYITFNPSAFSQNFQKDFYVDNLLTGTANELQAQQLYTTANQIFQVCSMNLRSWATYSPTRR